MLLEMSPRDISKANKVKRRVIVSIVASRGIGQVSAKMPQLHQGDPLVRSIRDHFANLRFGEEADALEE
jgi:hypothetical protein